MDRRTFLSTTGTTLASVTALSGCTERRLEAAEEEPPVFDGFTAEEEVPLPVTRRLGVGADAVRTAADGVEVPTLDELSTLLEERGIQVESLEEEPGHHGRLVSLAYVAAETTSEGLMHHLGLVAGGTAALVAGGHETETLEASLLQPDEEEFGTYEVRRHWAEAYNAGDLSAHEYAGEVLQHAESI